MVLLVGTAIMCSMPTSDDPKTGEIQVYMVLIKDH